MSAFAKKEKFRSYWTSKLDYAILTTNEHPTKLVAEQMKIGTVVVQTNHIFSIKNLRQTYGRVEALKGVSCHANRGEFLTILGSSGSGKSTMLRILAGLELPTSVDELTLDGVDVSDVPANHRNVSTVFQHYGLFPHLNVLKNVEYGLKVRKIPAEERRKQAVKMLEMVQLGDFIEASISKLSGGQKQRVALARSLVLKPSVLLLDEPLGALDEKLRFDMQSELVRLHDELGMTFVYVTHSQEEALTMSDRILLMDKGEIVQEGTPQEIFDRPNSRFAAEFMGMENVLTGEITDIQDHQVSASVDGLEIAGVWSGSDQPRMGQNVACAFRSEKLKLASSAGTDAETNSIPCEIERDVYRGKYHDVFFETAIGPLRARLWEKTESLATSTHLNWAIDQTVMLPSD